jgi:glycyl-tRNA synthetase beta chain
LAVSLADKLDSIVAFFLIGEEPTGSKDPFALRRAALGALSIMFECGLRLPMLAVTEAHLALVRSNVVAGGDDVRPSDGSPRVHSVHHTFDENGRQVVAVSPTSRSILAFFADRLKVQQREAGVRHDLIDAVFSLGGEDDLVRLLARVSALQRFVETRDGSDLLTGYKRAANILRKEDWSGEGGTPSAYEQEPEEAALVAALDAAGPKAEAAIAAEDFEGAMAALASLRAPVDAFFDKVTVNDPDEGKRAARLALLARMRDAVHRVADFSKIEG